MVSKLNMAASDKVDVVLNQSNTHSESSKAKPAKAKWEKKKWSNSEIHKLSQLKGGTVTICAVTKLSVLFERREKRYYDNLLF